MFLKCFFNYSHFGPWSRGSLVTIHSLFAPGPIRSPEQIGQ